MSRAKQPWMEQGICRQVDPDLFYSHETMRGRGLTMMVKQAKRICNTCPVMDQCLEFALEINDPHGIWGGTTARERMKMRRDRKKAA